MEISMTVTTPNCLDQWAEDARLFSANASNQMDGAQTIIVADFEYAYDRDRHHAYRVAEGASAEPTIRWPFHRIAAASWIALRFVAGEPLSEIGEPIVLTAEIKSEAAIASAFFDALRAEPDAQLVTWGGETKDFAVLRQVAMMQDLRSPPSLPISVRTATAGSICVLPPRSRRRPCTCPKLPRQWGSRQSPARARASARWSKQAHGQTSRTRFSPMSSRPALSR